MASSGKPLNQTGVSKVMISLLEAKTSAKVKESLDLQNETLEISLN